MPIECRSCRLPVVLLLAGLVAGVDPALAQGPSDPFAGLPNVTFSPYIVTGSDPRSIRASLDVSRPKDANDGRPVDALTRWHISWRLKQDATGCHAAAPLTYSADVTLPDLEGAGSLAAPARAKWEAFITALRVHEAGHARYAFDHMDDVQKALGAASCSEANAAGVAAVRLIAEHDISYDRQTKHGATQGATFP